MTVDRVSDQFLAGGRRAIARIARTSIKSCGRLAVAASVSLVLSTAPSAAFDIDVSDIPPVTPAKPPVNPNKCVISDQAAFQWIASNPRTAALNKAHEDIAKDWAQLPDNSFGHDKSRNLTATRNSAAILLKSQRAALWNLAVQIAGQRIPACDICHSLNNWGKLHWVSIRQGNLDDTIGEFKLADLTQAQVDSNKVSSKVNSYIGIVQLQKAAARRPASNTPQQNTAQNAICLEEVKRASREKTPPDASLCHQEYVAKWLPGEAKKIAMFLKEAHQANRSSPKMSTRVKADLECKPKRIFSYRKFVN